MVFNTENLQIRCVFYSSKKRPLNLAIHKPFASLTLLYRARVFVFMVPAGKRNAYFLYVCSRWLLFTSHLLLWFFFSSFLSFKFHSVCLFIGSFSFVCVHIKIYIATYWTAKQTSDSAWFYIDIHIYCSSRTFFKGK